MVRASDLVKGKAKTVTDLETEDTSPNQSALKETAIEEESVTKARMSLRLSEIDILKLKSGNQEEIPSNAVIKETVIIEASQESPAIDTATPELTMATKATQTPSEKYDDQQVAELAKVVDGEDGTRLIYIAAKKYMAQVRDQVINGTPIQLEPALTFVSNVIQSSHDMTSQIYQMTVDYEQDNDYYLSSPINTLVYGLKIAQRMGYTRPKLIEFGLAALLHDIGMFKIPDQILNKEGRLTDDEMAYIKRHPEFAVEIMASYAATYPNMISAIYEHQERASGQGYPRGLKGDEISDSAQIIGICDSYEAMTHYRPHKKILLQSDSIKELIGSRLKLFESRIIKMFLNEISIYPIGSYVRLNNRNIGRVVSTNKTNPMKPVVNLIFDEKGMIIEPPRVIDLKNYPVLNIEESISVEDLPSS